MFACFYVKSVKEYHIDMTKTTESLILEHMRAMRSDISDMREQNTDILKRLTSLETMVARMGRDLAEMAAE